MGLDNKMPLDENSRNQIILSMKHIASTFPNELGTFFTTEALVMGLGYIDNLLATKKDIYASLLIGKYSEDLLANEKEHVEQSLLFIAGELKTLFELAECFNTALESNGYSYEYKTSMSDVSNIISTSTNTDCKISIR